MSLDGGALAQVLWPHVGANDPKTGAPDPNPTAALTNYAKGYVAMLSKALAAHALPTGSGSAPPGGPLSGGKLSGGKFIAMLAPVMVAIASQGALPLAIPGLTLECTAIATYLIANGIINFAPGTVKGNSTATPTSPGILAAGNASGGIISGLAGGPLAQAVTAVTLQTGPKQVEFYTALCAYTMANALVTYPTGTVTGVCSNAGTFSLGIAAGGTVA